MTRDCFISNLLFKPTKTPLKLEDFQNPWRYLAFIYVVEELYNTPIPFTFLVLVVLCVFTPPGSSLDKGTIISYLGDSNSLLIGLFAPKCSFSTFPTIWPDWSFQIVNVIKSFACCSLTHVRLFCNPHGLQPTRLFCPWNFRSKNTGVGCHFLFQGVFPTQGWNLHLLHWQADSLLPGKPHLVSILLLKAFSGFSYAMSWPTVLVYEALPKLGRALIAKWPWDVLYHNPHHVLLELFLVF